MQIACASGDVKGASVGGHLSFKGASGDIDVGTIGAGATVRSASGDIRIGRLDGPTIITVGSGDIELRDVGPGLGQGPRDLRRRARSASAKGSVCGWTSSSTSGDVHSALDAARGHTDATPRSPSSSSR